MLTNKNKYIFYLVVLNCLLTILLVIYWKFIFNDVRSLTGITFALILFFVYEAIVIVLTENKGEAISPRQSINLFLGFKVGKTILSLLFIAVYAIVIKVELKRFILVFAALYFIYLLFDTIYWLNRERNLMKTRNYSNKEIKKFYNKKDSNTRQYKLKEIEKISNYYKR